MKKILLIDSHNLMHRARFGFGDGPHKIYFNFFRMLMGELKNHQPDIVYIVDEGKPVQSKALLETYKGNRPKLNDDNFFREKDEIFQTIKKISGFVYIKHPHHECDDVIGHLSKHIHKNDNVVIVSTDTDFIQLISDNIKLWQPKNKSFVNKWHVDYVIWKSLRGDPTDNIPGIKGVGDTTATKLAADASLLSKFLENDENKKQFDLCRQLIELKNVPSENLIVEQCDFKPDDLYKEFENRKFKSMTGNSWPKWVEIFKKCGGKNDFK